MGEKVYFETAAAARYRRIRCRISYPDKAPKGIIVIMHSALEHSGLYKDFEKYFSEKGYALVSHDAAGHGKSAVEKFELGFLSDSLGYHAIIEDAKKVVETAIAKIADKYGTNRKIPITIFGQGLGSSAAKLLAAESWCKGLVLIGDAGAGNFPMLKIWFTEQIAQIKGDRSRSDFFTKIALGAAFKPREFKSYKEALTSDEKMLYAYNSDPLCGFNLTLSAAADYLSMRLAADRSYDNINENIPVFILSGEKDIFTRGAKAAEEIKEKFQRAGNGNVTVKIYPEARHQLLREFCREEVYKDITEFLKTVK
ncbi:MAG: alpha/beta hydrolase [Oscillospiraceae bacterium]|nr:alpha/beta hydrolase [Oscillospiraceae bacterium]